MNKYAANLVRIAAGMFETSPDLARELKNSAINLDRSSRKASELVNEFRANLKNGGDIRVHAASVAKIGTKESEKAVNHIVSSMISLAYDKPKLRPVLLPIIKEMVGR